MIKEGITVYNPGTIIFDKESYKYLDQIDGKTLVSGNYISVYLMKTYGLTAQEYYNLVMYGGVNNTPVCYKCGKPREFIKISHGYKVRCKECLDKCHQPKPEKVYDVGTKAHKESIASKKRAKEGTHNFQNQSKESRLLAQINSSKNTFINRAKLRGITTAYMYIGWMPYGSIKVGITFVGLARRARSLRLRSVHLLDKGTPEYIAGLEHSLKLRFMNELINSNEEFESSKLHELIEFIKSNKIYS